MPKLSVAVLKNRNFRLLLVARAASAMALQAQAVIVGWQVYSLTHDVFLLGLIGLVEAVPAIGCALYAGTVVDNGNPRLVYLSCAVAFFFNTLALLLFAGNIISIPHAWLLPVLFSGVFISGIARSFNVPAIFSFLPDMVGRKELPAASAWLSSVFQIATIAGPAMAGLVYAWHGARGAWMIPATLMLVVFVAALMLEIAPIPRKQQREETWASIKAGWNFMLRTPVLMGVMAVDMFAVLFGGATAMLPAFADQILHVGAEGLGILRAGPAMGAIVTALAFALFPMQRMATKTFLWLVAGFGVCMIGFGLSTSFYLSLFFLALGGALDSVSVVIRMTMRQLLTPDEMRGRISSINSMFVTSSNEIGAFESGMAARLLGLVPSVVLGGVMTLLVVGVTALVSPKMRKTVVDAADLP